MSTSLSSAGFSAANEAALFNSGRILFYDGDPSSGSPTRLAVAFLRAKAFDAPSNGVAVLRGTPLTLDKEVGVDATATYAVIESRDEQKKTLLSVGTTINKDIVLNRTDITDGDGNTVQIEQFRIERDNINTGLDDVGSVKLTEPLGGETYVEGGVGSWAAKADLGDLRVEEMRLQESTDGGSTWATKDTIYYTVDRRDGSETDGRDNVGWREDYEEGVWTVDASATHVRAQMLLEDGRTVESSQVGISTEAPADTFSSLSNLLAADPTQYNVGDKVIVSDQEDRGQEFVLAADNAETDFCTVYMPDQITTQVTGESIGTGGGETLANTPVRAGTVKLIYGGDPDQYVTAREKHNFAPSGQKKPGFDFQNGEFYSGSNTAEYEYASGPNSELRWKRVHHGRIDVRWAGGVVNDQSQAVIDDNAAAYAWATIAARRWNGEPTGQKQGQFGQESQEWAFVDIPGMLWHRFTRAVAARVIPRGTGPPQDVPGQDWKWRGGFGMPDGEALWQLDSTRTPNRRARNVLGKRWGTYAGYLGHGDNDERQKGIADRVGLARFIKYDGNLSNNTQPFDNADFTDVSGKLQNGRFWTGLAGTEVTSTGRYIKDGCDWGIQYCWITKVGSDQMQVRDGDHKRCHNIVLTGGGVGDHQTYSIPSSAPIQRLTFTGLNSIGGAMQTYSTKVKDVELTDYETDPAPTLRVSNKVIDSRLSTGTFEEGNIANDNWVGAGFYGENIYVDCRGWIFQNNRTAIGVFNASQNKYFPQRIDNATVRTSDNANQSTRIFLGNNADLVAANIHLIHENANQQLQITPRAQVRKKVFRNLTVRTPRDIKLNDGTGQPLLFLSEGFTDVDGNDVYGHLLLENFRVLADTSAPVRLTGGGVPLADCFIDGGKILNRNDRIENTPGGGRDNNNVDAFLFMHDVGIQTHGGDFSQLGQDWLRVRNVEDQDGRSTDESGVYHSDSGDEGNSYVLIPTDLIYPAKETLTELMAAPSSMSISSTEYTDASGNSLGTDKRNPYLRVNLSESISAGDRIKIRWDAHVTPLADFDPHDVFVARGFPRQEIALGETSDVDIQGMFTTMEGNVELAEFAAGSVSSDDTNVLTTSFTSSDKRKVTVTPQGIGTADLTIQKSYPTYGEAYVTGQTVEIYGIKADVQANDPVKVGQDLTISLNITENIGRTITEVSYYDAYGTASETLLGTNSTGNDSSWPITYTTQNSDNLSITAVVSYQSAIDETFGTEDATILAVTSTDPLDSVGTSPSLALSTSRRLTSNFTGTVMTVYRDSDGVTADVGFDGNNIVSKSSPISNASDSNTYADLDAFAGTNTVRIDTIYDQSGSGAAYSLNGNFAAVRPILMQNGNLEGPIRTYAKWSVDGSLYNTRSVEAAETFGVSRPDTPKGNMMDPDSNNNRYTIAEFSGQRFPKKRPSDLASENTFINGLVEDYPETTVDNGTQMQWRLSEPSSENFPEVAWGTASAGEATASDHAELIVFNEASRPSSGDIDTLEQDQIDWFATA